MAPIAPLPKPFASRSLALEPFTEADAGELAELLLDPGLHSQGFVMYPLPTTHDEAVERVWSSWVARPGNPGGRVTWAIRLSHDGQLGREGTLVGASSLGDVDLANEEIHLGWTVYGRRWWGTPVNPLVKYILMREAFENLGFGRVRIQTDLLNVRSQAAIARLGATREGVLRRHKKRADGTFRDTVIFSVLSSEWPAVKLGLEERLDLENN